VARFFAGGPVPDGDRASVHFGVLGPLLIQAGGTEVTVRGARLRVLLAALLARAGRPVTVAELAEFVWDGEPPDGARDTVRAHLMRLRRALGPDAGARIATHAPGYRLVVSEEEVDALWFARCYQDGAMAFAAGRWAQARTAFADGLSLWRGDPLADIPSQLLRDAEAPALQRLRLLALHCRIDADLRLGGADELTPELQELIHAHPLYEHFHAQLMTALARSGRRAEALEAYQHARRVLIDQVGIEPGAELKELQRSILAGELTISEQVTGGMSRKPVPRQLPAAAGHFAGRAAELKQLDAALDRADQVTIATVGGMAGIGKTTLALNWAHQVTDRFPDGQLYVNLRGFGPAAPMAAAEVLRGFLDALRDDPVRPLPADPDAQAALYRSLLAERRILIVLDNARDEEQVRPLLPGTGNSLTLITSRSQLAGLVTIEGAIPVRPGPLTDAEAHELLSRRLGRERVTAEPSAAALVITACAGLPLALCIAAARAALAPTLSLAALSAQIGEPGLDALSGADPYADVRSVFSWSYQRLSPEAARLFRSLPAFPGPDVSLDSAASITPPGRAAQLLTELTSAHLVEEYRPGRYQLHDLLARYAQERAEQDDTEDSRREAVRRVLTWYMAAAMAARRTLNPDRRSGQESAEPDPVPAGITTEAGALEWLETERRNLVAAVRLAVHRGFDPVAAGLSLGLWSIFIHRALWQEMLDTQRIGLEAARRAGDLNAEAWLGHSLFVAYHGLGRPAEGIADLRRSLAIWEAQRDLRGQAITHRLLAAAYGGAGLVPEAITEYQHAISMSREIGDRSGEGRALNNMGWLYQHIAEPQRALRRYRAAYAIAMLLPELPLAGTAQANMAGLYLELGRTDDAIAAATTAIELNERCGHWVELANAHAVLGDALQRLCRDAEACEHWGAALAGYEELDDARAQEMRARLKQV
jgi:DNA-binding SARP family transcriptional activator/tetratricopeptide (TPR) repeat protein